MSGFLVGLFLLTIGVVVGQKCLPPIFVEQQSTLTTEMMRRAPIGTKVILETPCDNWTKNFISETFKPGGLGTTDDEYGTIESYNVVYRDTLKGPSIVFNIRTHEGKLVEGMAPEWFITLSDHRRL